MPPRFGRKSLREEISAFNAADRFYAMAADKEPQFQRELPKQRAPRKPSAKPREAPILKAIMKALRKHPKVARVERNTSGLLLAGDRYIRTGAKGKLDLTIYLRDGRYAELEVKRPGAELTQEQFVRTCKVMTDGGIAGVAHSVSEALAIINAA